MQIEPLDQMDPQLLWALIALVYFGFVFGIALGTAYWIYRDASLRGSDSADWWAFGTVLVLPITPFVYLVARRRLGPRAGTPTRRDRIVAAGALGAVAAFVGASLLSPPDPFSNALYTLGLSVVAFPLARVYVYPVQGAKFGRGPVRFTRRA